MVADTFQLLESRQSSGNNHDAAATQPNNKSNVPGDSHDPFAGSEPLNINDDLPF